MKRHDLIWLIGTLLAAAAFVAAFTLGLRHGGVGFLGFGMVSLASLTLRDINETSHRKKARREHMRQAATRLDFSFRETATFNVLGWSESFHLTRDGVTTRQAVNKLPSPALASVLLPTAENMVERSMDEMTVAVFDYTCDRSRSHDVTTRQTVFAVRSPRLAFPHFALVPSGWCDRLRGNVVLQARYWAISEGRGIPEELDERLFPLLDRRTCLEAGEGFLLLYRRNRVVVPEKVDELVRTGLEIFSILSGRMADV
jgi:hypothetical protein